MVKQKKMKKGPSAPLRGPKPAQASAASKNGKKAQRRKTEEEEVEEAESGEEGFKGEEWEGEDGSEGETGGGSSSEDDSDDGEEEEIKMFGQVEEDDEEDDEDEEEEEEEEPPSKGKGKGKQKAGGGQEKGAAGKKRKRKGKKGEEEEGGLMNITFEVSDPDERFFFGIRSLLSYLSHEGIPVSALSEWVVSEPGLGSVVHCADEDDVFALATAIPLHKHKSNEAVAALHALLESRCPASLLPSLRHTLGHEGTYLLLHHRFVNLPLPLVPALHKSIREDVAWAVKNTKGVSKVKSLILLCPCAADMGPSSSSSTSGDKKGKASTSGDKGEKKGKGKAKDKEPRPSASASSVAYAPSDAIYTHFEDELLVQKADLAFCFKRSLQHKQGGEGKGEREEAEAGAMVVCVVGDGAHASAIPEMEEMAGQLA